MLRKNSNYPLISDGESLFAVVMTVEKRERNVQEKYEVQKKALSDVKQAEHDKHEKEKTEAREKREQEEGKPKGKDLVNTVLQRLTSSQSKAEEVEFYHGQQYFVAVFKALKFDLDSKKKKEPKEEENTEVDFLSMKESELFEIPIMQEMFATFSGFYNIKRCALALQHNNDDIHDAGQWLIEGKDVPYLRAHEMKQMMK